MHSVLVAGIEGGTEHVGMAAYPSMPSVMGSVGRDSGLVATTHAG